jgi:ankyrin repeat protein
VRALLAKGASVHAEDDHSQGDALEWAVGLGHLEVVEALLAFLPPDENISDSYGWFHDPWSVAILMSPGEAARVMLEARPNEFEKMRLRKGLGGAAFWGLSTLVEPLLRLGADPNFADEDCLEMTALTVATVFGRSLIAQQLREAGATEGVLFPPSTNSRDRDLLRAAHEGDTDTVRLLLAEGANLEAREDICPDWSFFDTFDSWTPLFWAAAAGHRDTVEVLLAAGADVDATDNSDLAAFSWAVHLGHVDVVQAFLDAGVDPNKPSERAWRDGLYEYAVNLDSPASALGTAAGMGHTEVVRILLAGGADADGRTHCEPESCEKPSAITTPLMIATVFNHIDVVEALLNAGADIDLRDGNGKTALDLAPEYGRPEVAQLLRDFIREVASPRQRNHWQTEYEAEGETIQRVTQAEEAKQWAMKYEKGVIAYTSKPSRVMEQGSKLQLTVSEEAIICADTKGVTLEIPVPGVLAITYDNTSQNRGWRWLRQMSPHATTGGGMGGAAVGLAVLAVGGVLAPFNTRKHFVTVVWKDGRMTNKIVFKVGKGEYLGFLADLEQATGRPWENFPKQRKQVRKELRRAKEMKAHISLRLDRPAWVRFTRLRAGLYQLVLVEGGGNRADLYFFAGKKVDTNKVTTMTSVEIILQANQVSAPEAIYEGEYESSYISAIRLPDRTLHIPPPPEKLPE